MPTISIAGRTCFYQDVGTGYPLLLGHSYLWTSDMWQAQLKTLSQKFRCIAPDLWDHGQSGHLNTNTINLEHLADDAWELMNKLGIPQFAVIGLSIGGMWGAELAFKYPHAVKALVLMDTFLGEEPEVTRQKYFALLDILEREKQFITPLLNHIIPIFFSPATISDKPQLVEDFKAMLSCINEKNIPGIVMLGRAIFSRQCSLNKLSKLVQPILFLVGKDDIPRPPQESQKMVVQVPHSEIHIIEDAGHISCLEQPATVNAHLLDFLNKNVDPVQSCVSAARAPIE